MVAKPEFSLDDIKKLVFSGNRVTRGDVSNFPGVNDTVRAGIVNPTKQALEMTGAAQGYRGLKPGASATDRALGGLALAGLVGGFSGGAGSLPQLARAPGASNTAINRLAQSAAQKARSKVQPRAEMGGYLFHGGPKAENLVGGVIDPDYVRGGKLLAEVNPEYASQPSLVGPGGLNTMEDQMILDRFNAAQRVAAGENSPYFSSLAEAKAFQDKNKNIVGRIQAGEMHGTALDRFNPGGTYSHQGAIHVLKVPEDLQYPSGPARGETKFWGKQKPVASITGADEYGKVDETRAIQAMLDDADRTSMSKQRFANMLAQRLGSKVTPAYKTRAAELFEQEFGRNMPQYERNPKFGVNDREVLEYFQTYPTVESPMITNYEDVQRAIMSAGNEDELMAAIRSAQPNPQLDIDLANSVNPTTFDRQMASVMGQMAKLRGSYSRLK
jgi:hypothetical protein